MSATPYLNPIQKQLLVTELTKVRDYLNGVSSTPIDWAAILAALLPVLIQLLPLLISLLGGSGVTLDQPTKTALAGEIQTVIDNLDGVSSTPIDWKAIIAMLLPILLQLFGGGSITP